MFAPRGLIILAFALAAFFAGPAYAIETLKWQDLAPPWDETTNPVTELTDEQKDDLYAILWGPNFDDPSGKMDAEERKAHESLKASGVNPKTIITKIKKLREEADARDKILVFDLDKKVVKLPGYVLPLDFEGTLVKSFLLVPFVGACIHVPPPPPNQIVHVEPLKGFESEGLFGAVWVTGRITVGMGKESLNLVDGSSDVGFGYTMQATKVEPYEN